jgi:uncharacterized membrane protein YhiD involved in acid resistance
MRKFLKFVVVFSLICFVGLPAAFILFVMGMAAFGVVIGIGAWIIGMMLTVLKFALIVLLPLMLLCWVAKRLLSPERSY